MAACLANLGMPTHHTTPPAPAAAGGPAKWTVGSWRAKTALQQPEYPDAAAAEAVLRTVESFPPLVLPGEARVLEERLAAAAAGRAFVLQGGDCAESFRELGGGASARDTFRVLRQMAAVLVAGAQTPVVTVGRVAGQFEKPRSDVFEERGDGVRLLKYRGDIVNGHDFDEKSRAPDPQRMLRAYAQSAATLNLLRALAAAGGGREQGCRSKYPELARHVDGEFMAAAAAAAHLPQQQHYEFWTSHECLLLPYEQALTRREERGDDDDDGDSYYGSSAHMLWVGERTRQLDGAHVEFLRGLSNPLGIKVSDQLDPVELVKLIEILNPSNRPGRITVITRMGADNLRAKLPLLIRAVRSAGQTVTWVTDPMHGNTTVAPCGRRTRHFSAILAEVQAFFDVHEQEGSNPGGIHLEMTGQHVTECVGGSCNVSYDDLSKRYYTHCDPRLNASQSLELSFIVGQRLLRDRMHRQKAQHF